MGAAGSCLDSRGSNLRKADMLRQCVLGKILESGDALELAAAYFTIIPLQPQRSVGPGPFGPPTMLNRSAKASKPVDPAWPSKQ
jgi:hypothetical protein